MSASNAGRVMITGASGSGKSSYTKQLIANRRRVVVLDPEDEYCEQGMVRCENIGQVQAAMRKNFNGFRIAYVPPASMAPTALNRLSHLCLAAQKPFKGKSQAPILTLVVEEMSRSFHVSWGASRVPAFNQIATAGRHSSIETIGVTQRLAQVDTEFRGNCTEAVVFRQQGPHDQTAAHHMTGAPKSQIIGLKNLECLRSVAGEITAHHIQWVEKQGKKKPVLKNGKLAT